LKTTVVIPTIRPEMMPKFLQDWQEELKDAHIIVVEDHPTRSLSLEGGNVSHYCQADVTDAKLDDVIPFFTCAIANFGFLQAKADKPDFIVMLNDDVKPLTSLFLQTHAAALGEFAVDESAWVNTGTGVWARGVPYRNRARHSTCVVNHGLWAGNPDLDALTSLYLGRVASEMPFEPCNRVIPVGRYFPFSDINFAFTTSALPMMFLAPMGKGYPFWRFEDVWMGVVLKKVCDHLGLAVRSGMPLVKHTRASNVWANLRGEATALEFNEMFWQQVDSLVLTGRQVGDCMNEIGESFVKSGDTYLERYGTSILRWVELTC
jgi:hypothetical protein